LDCRESDKKIRLRLLVFLGIRLHPKTSDYAALVSGSTSRRKWKIFVTLQNHKNKTSSDSLSVDPVQSSIPILILFQRQ